MAKFITKSWADLAYENSSSDSELDENDLPIQKTQSQNVQIPQQNLPDINKSMSLNHGGMLPRYFQRVLKAVQEQDGTIIEVAVRDCPKGVTEQILKDAMPVVACIITEELVTVFINKADIIDHIERKQLQQVQDYLKNIIKNILNQMCTLCIQSPSEESKKIEEQRRLKISNAQRFNNREARKRNGQNGSKQPKYQIIYKQKLQDD